MTAATDIFWPPERHAMLCELYGDGLYYTEIGRELGLSKNAIAGRIHRTGLSLTLASKRHENRIRRRYERDYRGPTTLDRLRALHRDMDIVLAEAAALRAAGRMMLRESV